MQIGQPFREIYCPRKQCLEHFQCQKEKKKSELKLSREVMVKKLCFCERQNKVGGKCGLATCLDSDHTDKGCGGGLGI